jgi:hypothetical protein
METKKENTTKMNLLAFFHKESAEAIHQTNVPVLAPESVELFEPCTKLSGRNLFHSRRFSALCA